MLPLRYSLGMSVALMFGLAILIGSPSWAAPVPKGIPTMRAKLAGELIVPDQWIDDAAVIDDNLVVVVGTKADKNEDADRDTLKPNGALLELNKKVQRPFTNGHTARIGSVSIAGNRIATAGNHKDPTLRIWDHRTKKAVAEIEIEKAGENRAHYGVASFHKTDRIAISADTRLIILDPAKPDDRVEYPCPEPARWLTRQLAVSPDDSWIASPANTGQVVFWKLSTGKATALSLVPEKSKVDDDWSSTGVAFGPKGSLVAWRSENRGEVPAGTLEKDASPDRRGVVEIDLGTGKMLSLKMGQSIFTIACGTDSTGTWLATGGNSHKDKPTKDAIASSELRIYHLPTGALVHREQLEGLPLSWLSFTPSGKRIVAATHDGVVRCWDIETK